MNRPGTALGVLLCTLAASLLALGSARGAGKIVPPRTNASAGNTQPEVMQVTYIMTLPEAGPRSGAAHYECGQRQQPHNLELATELPVLTQIGEVREAPVYLYTAETDDEAAPAGANEATIRALLKPAPAVIFDLDTSDEPPFSGDVIDWETAVYENYLGETLDAQSQWRRGNNNLPTAAAERSLESAAMWLSHSAGVASHWMAQTGLTAVYPVLWDGVEQARLERDLAELFGDASQPRGANSTELTGDAYASTLKIEKHALLGAARALDQLGQSLQGISQRLERLSQADVAPNRYALPAATPRSSRIPSGERAR